MDLSGTKRLQASFTQRPGKADLEGNGGLKVDDLKIKNLSIGKDNKIHVSITGFSRWQAARSGKPTGEQALRTALAQAGWAKGFRGAIPAMFADEALKQGTQLRANPAGRGPGTLRCRNVAADTSRNPGHGLMQQEGEVHAGLDSSKKFLRDDNLSVLLEMKELQAREFKGLNLKELVMSVRPAAYQSPSRVSERSTVSASRRRSFAASRTVGRQITLPSTLQLRRKGGRAKFAAKSRPEASG